MRTLICLLLGICGCSILLSVAAHAEPPRPNVILLMADDQGYGDAGFQGHPTLKTPHLDAMAAEGLVLSRFYSGSPVCSPTRGSALTGRHPHRYGIVHANSGRMKPQEVTLAEVLKSQGYRTGMFGKWHLGTMTKTVKDANRGGPGGAKHYSPPQDNGFDVCFATESKVPTWDPAIRGGKSEQWWDPINQPDDAPHYGTRFWNERGEVVERNLRGDASRVIMDRAVPFIRSASADEQPFFAVVWFHAPHLPVVAGKAYTDMYPDENKYTQHYYGCITAMDEQVGRLRAELRELGIAENTIVFYCSDNGPEGKHGQAPGSTPFRGRKRDVYEGGVRVPGIVAWPGRIEAGETDFPTSTLDYFPTVVELLGLTLSDVLPDERPIDGVSIAPLLAGRQLVRDKPIPLLLSGNEALIGPRYKLVRYSQGQDELYDIPNDPREANDLAKQMPEVVRAMRAEFDQWRASAKASAAGDDYAND